MWCLSLKCFLLFSLLICVNADKIITQTTHGNVSGKKSKTILRDVEYYEFLGIPYAVPPLKELRFLPPQPLEPWNGVLSAGKEKQPCIQYNYDLKKGRRFGPYGTEDCLYLNIATPAVDDKKRAIIVFLHNEYFRYSYNKTDYRPDFFIEEDVVIVTINHRLSLFGFLSLENEILPGNAGLKDIVAALGWIKNNIMYFGGDPKRITLMGSQGGAAAVDLLLHSKARELFSSVVLQSGTSWSARYLQNDARQRAFRLAELLDRATTSDKRLLQELNEISPADLLTKDKFADPQDYFKENQRNLLAFGPTIETHSDGLITEYPERAEHINMPVMIGFNSREGLEASLEYLLEPKYMGFLRKDFPLVMPRRLNFRFDPVGDSYFDAVEEIKKFYFPKGKVKITNIPEYVTYIGDVLTSYAVDVMTQKYSNVSSDSVFYYHFDYYSELNENKNNLLKLSKVAEGTWGAASGDDLCYLFMCPSLRKKYLKYNEIQSEEIVVLRKLVRLWSNFAKYGNPTPGDDGLLDNLRWNPYKAGEYLHIDKQFQPNRNSINNRFRFWERFIQKWGREAVNGIISDARNKDEL